MNATNPKILKVALHRIGKVLLALVAAGFLLMIIGRLGLLVF